MWKYWLYIWFLFSQLESYLQYMLLLFGAGCIFGDRCIANFAFLILLLFNVSFTCLAKIVLQFFFRMSVLCIVFNAFWTAMQTEWIWILRQLQACGWELGHAHAQPWEGSEVVGYFSVLNNKTNFCTLSYVWVTVWSMDNEEYYSHTHDIQFSSRWYLCALEGP